MILCHGMIWYRQTYIYMYEHTYTYTVCIYIYMHNIYIYNHILITHVFVTLYESSPPPIPIVVADACCTMKRRQRGSPPRPSPQPSPQWQSVAHLKRCAGWFGTFFNILFFHILGIVTPTDCHIFQRGWNHQPEHDVLKKNAKVIHRNCSNCSIFFWCTQTG